ncbi:hypothetical protein [Coralloluteibacterium stylophorae]|uniref:EF-hand domain-containing protein n=1 Tax=Coralloluteibacterium stylophorae TaxID=1776034 RepID=A0A8J7VSB2_9GAMM|nr:hypothetical protein [Coralloluteibacterium stylophorae]MBS7455840.1 hypothetical protein [Coralloluteibacterium stylophorae]
MTSTRMLPLLLGAVLAAPVLAQTPPVARPTGSTLPPPPPLPPPPSAAPAPTPAPAPMPQSAPRSYPAQAAPASTMSGPAPNYGANQVQLRGAAGQTITIRSRPGDIDRSQYVVDFGQFDRNGDGRITRGEVPAGHPLQGQFHVVDSDNDGSLTRQELSGWLR